MQSRKIDIFFNYSFNNPLVNKNLDWKIFDTYNETEAYTYDIISGFFIINTPANYIPTIIHKMEKSTGYIDLRR